MLRFQLAWKAYFWILVVLTILSVGIEIQERSEVITVASIAWDVFSLVVTVVGFVGLFGFVWQEPVGKPEYWKVVFVLNVLMIVGALGYGLVTEPGVEKSSIAVTLFIVGVIAAFMAPYFVASFRYAFRSRHIWVAP